MPCAAPQKEKKKDDSSATFNMQQQNQVLDSLDALGQVKQAIQNKIRNLEKRKTKLESYGSILSSGKELTPDQTAAYAQLSSVEFAIETQNELMKNVGTIQTEFNKQQKISKKKEERERQQSLISKFRDLIRYQDVLNSLGDDVIRADFLEGKNGAMKSTKEDLDVYDVIFKKLCPCEKESSDFTKTLDESAQFAYNFLNASSKIISAEDTTTYAQLKEKLDKITGCAYFVKKTAQNESTDGGATNLVQTDLTGGVESDANQSSVLPPASNPYNVESARSFGSSTSSGAGGADPSSPLMYSATSATMPMQAPSNDGGELLMMSVSSLMAPNSVAAVELPPTLTSLPPRSFVTSDVAATLSFMHDDQMATPTAPGVGNMTFASTAGSMPQAGLNFVNAVSAADISPYCYAPNEPQMQQNFVPDKQANYDRNGNGADFQRGGGANGFRGRGGPRGGRGRGGSYGYDRGSGHGNERGGRGFSGYSGDRGRGGGYGGGRGQVYGNNERGSRGTRPSGGQYRGQPRGPPHAADEAFSQQKA